LLLFLCITFLSGCYLHFTHTKEGLAALLIIALSELGLLYKLDALKKALIQSEHGDYGQSSVPHDDESHKTSRYLMFKTQLHNQKITKYDVEQCLDLLNAQIDLATSNRKSVDTFSTFSIGMILGILAAFWRDLSSSELIIVGISYIVFAIFIILMLSSIPSKLERLKEMKYFMKLYYRRDVVITKRPKRTRKNAAPFS